MGYDARPMKNLFWPSELNPDPTIGVRLGRVLHWIAIFLAIWPIIFSLNSEDMQPDGRVMFYSIAAGIYMVGRAARYIFGNE